MTTRMAMKYKSAKSSQNSICLCWIVARYCREDDDEMLSRAEGEEERNIGNDDDAFYILRKIYTSFSILQDQQQHKKREWENR